jgi:hypothetical protein
LGLRSIRMSAQAFARVLIDDRQNAKPSPVHQPVTSKVHALSLIRIVRFRQPGFASGPLSWTASPSAPPALLLCTVGKPVWYLPANPLAAIAPSVGDIHSGLAWTPDPSVAPAARFADRGWKCALRSSRSPSNTIYAMGIAAFLRVTTAGYAGESQATDADHGGRHRRNHSGEQDLWPDTCQYLINANRTTAKVKLREVNDSHSCYG